MSGVFYGRPEWLLTADLEKRQQPLGSNKIDVVQTPINLPLLYLLPHLFILLSE